MTQIDSRIKLKRSSTPGNTPTIGPSQDNRDGTWDENDIFTGELFFNSPDNRLWIGGLGTPQEIYMGGTNGIVLPTAILFSNENPLSVVPFRGTHTNEASYSSILGGNNNIISGTNGTFNNILGGNNNTISGVSELSGVLSGKNHIISNCSFSTVLGGESNSIISFDNTHIIGSNIIATQNHTTFINNLISTDDIEAGTNGQFIGNGNGLINLPYVEDFTTLTFVAIGAWTTVATGYNDKVLSILVDANVNNNTVGVRQVGSALIRSIQIDNDSSITMLVKSDSSGNIEAFQTFAAANFIVLSAQE